MMERFTPPPADDQPGLFDCDQPESGRYPDTPGHRGVDTSAAAAEGLAPHLGRLQRLTLDAITDAGAHGLTANELAAALDVPREAIQPRTSELRRKGLIVDSGTRRFNSNGKKAIVWTLPEYRREGPDA